MKFGLMLATAGVIAASGFTAEAAPGFSATGEGSWELLCQVFTNGEAKTVILSPSTTAYAHPKLTRGSCGYRASPQGDLTISVTDVSACPFAGAPVDACKLAAPKGKRGSFKFQAAPAR